MRAIADSQSSVIAGSPARDVCGCSAADRIGRVEQTIADIRRLCRHRVEATHAAAGSNSLVPPLVSVSAVLAILAEHQL
jgi:hypothetical protein